MKERFSSLRLFCLFIAPERSGQSLIAASLDAHAHAAISSSAAVLRYMKQGVSREELFESIFQISQVQASKGRRGAKGVVYFLPDQHHGKSSKLYVIGDRDGDLTCEAISQGHWSEIDRLYACAYLRVKWLHVIRHPLDNIGDLSKKPEVGTIEQAIDDYFRYADATLEAKERVQSREFIDIYFEKWRKSPKEELKRLCTLLDLKADEKYLQDCATLVDRELRGRYRAYSWAEGQMESIMERAEKYPWLAPYVRKWKRDTST